MMRNRSFQVVVCLFVLFTFVKVNGDLIKCSAENTNSHLWRVNLSHPVYLFGSLHTPYYHIWHSLPANVKTAFASSDTFSFELDTHDPSVAQEIRRLQRLPSEVGLDQVLSPGMFQRVKSYVDHLQPLLRRWLSRSAGFLGGYYTNHMMASLMGDWERKRPIWLLILLNKLTEEHIERENGQLLLDFFMKNAAKAMGKDVDWLESAEEQMRPFNLLSLEEVTFAFELQLEILEEYILHNKPLPQMVDVLTEYTCGRFSDVAEQGGILVNNVCQRNMTPDQIAKLKAMRNHLMLGLRYRRNRKMAVKVVEKIITEPNKTHFVAVGAGHLIGNRSVIHYLQLLGYQVEHMTCTDHIAGPSVPSNIIQLGDPSTVPRIMDFSEFEDIQHSDGDTTTADTSYLSTNPTTTHPLTLNTNKPRGTHPESSGDRHKSSTTPTAHPTSQHTTSKHQKLSGEKEHQLSGEKEHSNTQHTFRSPHQNSDTVAIATNHICTVILCFLFALLTFV